MACVDWWRNDSGIITKVWDKCEEVGLWGNKGLGHGLGNC